MGKAVHQNQAGTARTGAAAGIDLMSSVGEEVVGPCEQLSDADRR